MMQPASLAAADCTIGRTRHLAMAPSGDGPVPHAGGSGLRPLADARGSERPDNPGMEQCAASSIEHPVTAAADASSQTDRSATLEQALLVETAERRRSECMAHIQDQAAQLALDLIVTEPEIAGFFA